MLEGDDYWTHPDKLQRQVELLEAAPWHAICCHKVQLCSGSSQMTGYSPDNNPKTVSTITDLLRKHFVPTCSNVFRRALFQKYPEWMCGLGMADCPLNILIAEHGTIAYIDEVMAVHRLHAGGVWSGRTARYRFREELKLYECLKSYFGQRFSPVIDQQLFTARKNCAISCAIEADWGEARFHAHACISTKPYHRNLFRKCALLGLLYSPVPFFETSLVQSRLRRKGFLEEITSDV
jgi:hypothetical protein